MQKNYIINTKIQPCTRNLEILSKMGTNLGYSMSFEILAFKYYANKFEIMHRQTLTGNSDAIANALKTGLKS